MKSVEDIEKEASSRSINKTINEIVRLSQGRRISSNGQLHEKLHQMLFQLLHEKARFWYQRGFKRGHDRDSAKHVVQ